MIDPARKSPPRLASWLLRRVLPPDTRGAAILGDLLEEFHTTNAATADAAARRYWQHALSIVTRYLLARARWRRLHHAETLVQRDDLPAPRRAPMGFGLLHEDVRYALRALVRTPTFTLIALATLALGIGASTAIFSLAYTVLVRPLPYAHPDRLVFGTETTGTPTSRRVGIAWPNFIDWQARARSFDDLAGTLADDVNVTGDRPRRLTARLGTWNFFRVLGVQPILGRLFAEADARLSSPRIVVISHELWVRDYGADPATIGQTMSIEHTPYTIVGVVPPGFVYRQPANVYLPLEPSANEPKSSMSQRGNHSLLRALGRLKPSVTVEQARAELQTIAANLASEYPNTNSGSGADLVPLAEVIVERYRSTFIVLAGAVGLLLLIACVNLANLLLNRGSARAHELAVRAALGGSRWRLVRQLLVEQALLIALGVLLGAITGSFLLRALVALAPSDVPRLNEVHLNDALLLATAGAAGLCALAFGFIPALKASSVRGQELVVRAGRTAQLSTTRVRRSLMIAEVAVATILLVGSGLMVRTMLYLTHADPGFDPQNLLTLNMALKGDTWPDEKRPAVYEPIVERLKALPGVESAGLTMSLPIDGSRWGSIFILGDKPIPPRAQLPTAAFTPVTRGYFDTMKIRLLRGRVFDRTETPTSPAVAVINETAARQLWPGEDPIGKRLKQGWPEEPEPWRTIVGVVADVKSEGMDLQTPLQIYLPLVHIPIRELVAVVRGGHVDTMTQAVSGALREFDKEMPIYQIQMMREVMSTALAQKRVSMVVLSVFGGVALLLAMIGLYGVISYGVNERTQEIGLRMALGATNAQVLRQFLQQGLIAATSGIALGIVIALGLTRWLETLLFGVTATDLPTFAAVIAVLLAVALAACYIPARRAARVDPLIALRCE